MLKWVSPGQKGVPDNIVFWPGGKIHFIEFKTSKKHSKRDTLQLAVMRQIAGFGPTVHLFCTHEQFEAYLLEVLTSAIPNTRTRIPGNTPSSEPLRGHGPGEDGDHPGSDPGTTAR